MESSNGAADYPHIRVDKEASQTTLVATADVKQAAAEATLYRSKHASERIVFASGTVSIPLEPHHTADTLFNAWRIANNRAQRTITR